MTSTVPGYVTAGTVTVRVFVARVITDPAVSPKRTVGMEPVVAKSVPVIVTVTPPPTVSSLGVTVEIVGPGTDAAGIVNVAVVPADDPRVLLARTVK
jgi:hypothetical protein